MNGRANQPRRGGRRVSRLNELERRVARLESEVEWLRRSLDARGGQSAPIGAGTCPNCPDGVLLRYGGELRCETCGYSRFL